MAYLKTNGPSSPYIFIMGGQIGFKLGYVKSIHISFNHSSQFEIDYNNNNIQCLPATNSYKTVSCKCIHDGNSFTLPTILSTISDTNYNLHENEYINTVYANKTDTSFELHENLYITTVNSNITDNSFPLHSNQYNPVILSSLNNSNNNYNISFNSEPSNLDVSNEATFNVVPITASVYSEQEKTVTINYFNSIPAMKTIFHEVVDNSNFHLVSSIKENKRIVQELKQPNVDIILPTPQTYTVSSDSSFEFISDAKSIITTIYIPKQIPKPIEITTPNRLVIPPGSVGYVKNKQKLF